MRILLTRTAILIAALAVTAAACGSTAAKLETQPGASGKPVDLEPGEQVAGPETDEDNELAEPTAADLAHARNFLRKLDLPDEPLPFNSVEFRTHLGLCRESFGVEVANRDLAVETGEFIFWVGEDPEMIELNERALLACVSGLEILGAGFPGDNRDSKKARYDLRVEEYDCLVEHGYPTSEPPPPGHFFQNPQMWSPWSELTGLDFGAPYPDERTLAREDLVEYAEALEVCPRLLVD